MPTATSKAFVALLAEGVDRNIKNGYVKFSRKQSPSSRRAWIEIVLCRLISIKASVALLAEGVDRNLEDETMRIKIR